MNRDELVLNALREHGPMRYGQIRDVTGLPEGQLRRSLVLLMKYHSIRVVSGGSTNHYTDPRYYGLCESEAPVRLHTPTYTRPSRCRKAILVMLEKGPMTTKELALATGFNRETVRQRLNGLIEDGLVEVDHSRRERFGFTDVWRLVSWQDAHFVNEKQ